MAKVRRLASVFDLIIITIALVASSSSSRVSHLVLTYGVIYAIGGSLVYTLTISCFDERLIRRKDLAFSIILCGYVKFLMAVRQSLFDLPELAQV